MVLRHYIYADVAKINSIFEQLYPNIENISISRNQETQTTLNAGVSLPSILQGFLGTNLSGEIGKDWGRGISYSITIPLEKKIELLMSQAHGNEMEPIDLTIQSDVSLVLGNTISATVRYFQEFTTPFLQEHGIKAFDDIFSPTISHSEFQELWDAIAKNGMKKLEEERYNGLPLMKIQEQIYHDPDQVVQLIIINSQKPMSLCFSVGKILLSHSSMESLGFFARSFNQNVLGILSKKTPRLYSIKPLAMWRIMDYNPSEVNLYKWASKYMEDIQK